MDPPNPLGRPAVQNAVSPSVPPLILHTQLAKRLPQRLTTTTTGHMINAHPTAPDGWLRVGVSSTFKNLLMHFTVQNVQIIAFTLSSTSMKIWLSRPVYNANSFTHKQYHGWIHFPQFAVSQPVVHHVFASILRNGNLSLYVHCRAVDLTEDLYLNNRRRGSLSLTRYKVEKK